MSVNPADILKRFFDMTEDNSAFRQQQSMIGLMSLLAQIRSELEAWRSMGRTTEADMFDGAVDRYVQAIYSTFASNAGLGLINSAMPAEGDMGLLNVLSEKLNQSAPALDEKTRASVSALVEHTLAALKIDDTLPDLLRAHILKLIFEVKRCLDEYEVFGDFALTSAIERLLANIQVAEGKSEGHKSAWTKVRDEWIIPVGVAIISGGPQTYLALETYLQTKS